MRRNFLLNSVCVFVLHCIIMPPPRRGGGGIRRSSASVVRPSVLPSVCLMSRTSALTRKPKGLGRRNFAQGYPRSHATPTPTSKSKGQKSRWGGAYCGGDLAAQLVTFVAVHSCSHLIYMKIICLLSFYTPCICMRGR